MFPRPSGKRCFVVSCNGTTISRLRNGSILHRFPSALPNGARKKDVSGSSQSYSILDCIFHEVSKLMFMNKFLLFNVRVGDLGILTGSSWIKLTMLLTWFVGGATRCTIALLSSGSFG